MPNVHADHLVAYADALRALPFVRSARLRPARARDEGADAVAELTLSDGSKTALQVEVKSTHLEPSALRQWRSRPRTARSGWLLAAPYVGAPLGDALADLGVNFIDRQGNCYVQLGSQFVARIQGRTPPKPPARTKEMRAPGYQVLFALLTDPELVAAPQRDIAEAAGTSKQPVADLLRRLSEERILVARHGKHAWARQPDRDLLERFLAGYRSTLRPKLIVGRYRLPVREPREVEAWLEGRLESVRFGGTAGAYRLEPHYRGPLTVVHLGPPSDETRRRLKAVPATDGELVWMRHIGAASEKGETDDTVHPLLIHAELASDPDLRAAEAAELIREKWLPWSL